MCFNPHKRHAACHEPCFPTTSTTIILGVTFRTDCSFSYHVSNLVKKSNYALQSLTTLSRLGFPVNQLRLPYTNYTHPLLEYAYPVWGPHLHNNDYLGDNIEAFQDGQKKSYWAPNMTRI